MSHFGCINAVRQICMDFTVCFKEEKSLCMMGKLLLKIKLLLVSSLNQVVGGTQLCYSPRN